MIQCRLCQKQFKMITNTHLKKAHQTTTTTYLQSFPGAALIDEEMRERIIESRHHVERPVCARLECTQRVTNSWNKFCSGSCRSKVWHTKKPQEGSNNPAWRGGWYSLGKKRKKQARERDGYACQNCFKVVIPERCFDNPEEAHALDNLVTLCSSCHLRVEWTMIHELYRRAVKLDELLEGDSQHQSLEAFKHVLLNQC